MKRDTASIEVTDEMILAGQRVLDRLAVLPDHESWMSPESLILKEVFTAMAEVCPAYAGIRKRGRCMQ
jgi:hypothetical protein